MPLILGTNSIKDTGYNVDNSLRFDDGSSDYLIRGLTATGNQKKWTWSAWIKVSKTGSGDRFLWSTNNSDDGGGNFTSIQLEADKLRFYNYSGGAFENQITTSRVLRDPSAWYHLMVVYDSANSTADDRIKIYINGSQETSFAVRSNPSVNQNSYVENNYDMYIGTQTGTESYFDGYMTEVVFVNDATLDPTSFGEFDSNSPTIWKPKDVSGLTFGTNGFYLDFEDSSALGNDVSGNNNDFTVNNLTAIDQSTDTCTNNFATLNPIYHYIGGAALSEGNLKFTTSGNSSVGRGMSTIRPESGKWYVECKIIDVTRFSFGLMNGNETNSSQGGENTNSVIFDYVGGFYMAGGFSGYLSAPSNNDIVQLALDLDNDLFWIGINDTWGNSATRTEIENGTATNDATTFISSQVPINTGAIGIFVEDNSSTGNNVAEINFGNPTFSISSGNADANGYGNFEYAVPSGYYALCTKNLAEFG